MTNPSPGSTDKKLIWRFALGNLAATIVLSLCGMMIAIPIFPPRPAFDSFMLAFVGMAGRLLIDHWEDFVEVDAEDIVPNALVIAIIVSSRLVFFLPIILMRHASKARLWGWSAFNTVLSIANVAYFIFLKVNYYI